MARPQTIPYNRWAAQQLTGGGQDPSMSMGAPPADISIAQSINGATRQQPRDPADIDEERLRLVQEGMRQGLSLPDAIKAADAALRPLLDRRTMQPITPSPPQGPLSPEPTHDPQGNIIPEAQAQNLVRGYVREGPVLAARSLGNLITGEGGRAQAITNLSRGVGMTALPFAPYAAPAMAAQVAANPIGTLSTLGTGALATQAAPVVAREHGASPETAEAIGEVVGNLDPGMAMGAGKLGMAGMLGASSLRDIFGKAVTGDAKRWMQHLSSPEATALKLSPALTEEFMRVRSQLPKVDLVVGAIMGGRDKRGWYEHSRQAIQNVFGNDADLFAGLLAATSPQNSVEMNLQNATRIYANWTTAGRPKDRDAIVKIMEQSVVGARGPESVLDAWKNNTVRALTGESTISGPKVDSFWTNLRQRGRVTPYGNVAPEEAVTLDAWMANVFGVDNQLFRGKKPTPKELAAGNPGYSGGYLAGTSLMREAATKLGVEPAEAQEMAWSFGKVLYEMSEATGKSARELVASGAITPQAISGTPDFNTLLANPQHAGALQNVPGLAPRIATLQAQTGKALPPPTKEQSEWMLKAADKLDELRRVRTTASDYRTAQTPEGQASVSFPLEAAPGQQSKVDPGFAQLTAGQQDRVSQERLGMIEDLRGRNVFAEAMRPGQTAPTRRGRGYWPNSETGQIESNVLSTTPMSLRTLQKGGLHPRDTAAADFTANLQAVALGQDMPSWSAIKFAPGDATQSDAVRVVMANKLTDDQFKQFAQALPEGTYPIHKTDGLDIVKWDGTKISEAERESIGDRVKALLPPMKQSEARKFRVAPGDVVGSGGGENLPWGGAGARTITEMLSKGYNNLTNAERARMNAPAVKTVFARLASSFEKNPDARQDHLNLLRIGAKDGIAGIVNALGDPSQLLPVLAALGVGSSLAGAIGKRGVAPERGGS